MATLSDVTKRLTEANEKLERLVQEKVNDDSAEQTKTTEKVNDDSAEQTKTTEKVQLKIENKNQSFMKKLVDVMTTRVDEKGNKIVRSASGGLFQAGVDDKATTLKPEGKVKMSFMQKIAAGLSLSNLPSRRGARDTEKNQEGNKKSKKTNDFLKTIANSTTGLLKNQLMKIPKAVGGGIMKLLKGVGLGLLLLALLKFVNSPMWFKFLDLIGNITKWLAEKMVPFFKDLYDLITDFSWGKLGDLFGEHKTAMAIFAAAIALPFLGIGGMAFAAFSAVRFALLGSLGLVKKGVGFALKKPLKLAKTGLKRIASNASNKIGNALRSVWGSGKGKSKKLLDLGMKKGQSVLNIAKNAAGRISGSLNSIFSIGKGKIAGGLAKAGGGLQKMASAAAKLLPSAAAVPRALGAAAVEQPKSKKGLAKIGKGLGRGLLAGAKFLPGVGLGITAAIGLYDGFTAGFKEYKKSGDIGKAVKEGAAGAISGLTFGLISQETISKTFTSIGDKFDSLTTGITDAASKAWTGVKTLIPTEEGLKKSFTKLKDNLAPLSEIKLPTEVSFSEIKKSVGTMATALNTSFANITGIDISKTLTSIKDGVTNKAKKLLTSFENITGIDIGGTLKGIKDGVASKAKDLVKGFEDITGLTVPTFADVKSKIADIGSKLSASFSGLMDDAKGFFGSTSKWFKGLFSSKPDDPETEALEKEMKDQRKVEKEQRKYAKSTLNYMSGPLVGKNQYKRSLMTGGSEYGEYDLSALPPAKTIIRADKMTEAKLNKDQVKSSNGDFNATNIVTKNDSTNYQYKVEQKSYNHPNGYVGAVSSTK